MKILSVRIRNFRSIKDQTIRLDDYTCLVGPNGSGKSNVLHALNVFFREPGIPGLDTHSLMEEDFYDKNTDEAVEITLTFGQLSDEAREDLSHYVRHDHLIVSATAKFDPATGKAEIKQYGRRLAIRDFASFFDAVKQGKKVDELKAIYSKIRSKYTDLPPPGRKDALIQALRDYEEGHPEQCEDLPSADEFYGISKGKNRLERYIQWVYVPAVKDASSEQAEGKNTALGKLLARTVRARVSFADSLQSIRAEAQQKYRKLLADSEEQLQEISQTLAKRLIQWAHKDASLRLTWHQDPEKAVRLDEPFAQAILGEAGFEGEPTRFGHGLQRSFLLALLQELSGSNAEEGPRLILACEEPELYQHPPQARQLYNVLMGLSEKNSQILITTHSPYFVSGEAFENVRMVRKARGSSVVTSTTCDEVSKSIADAKGEVALRPPGQLAKIHQALQPELSEMFFASNVIFVEGLEDVAYITTYLHLMGLWEDYRRLGSHMVPTQGKSAMLQPIAVARHLGIPAFVVFDADCDKEDRAGSRKKHRKDNEAILALCGVSKPEPFPTDVFWADRMVMWDSDIGRVVQREIGEDEWTECRVQADRKYGHAPGLRKNALHIATSLEIAWGKGKKSSSLEKLCKSILSFGRANV